MNIKLRASNKVWCSRKLVAEILILEFFYRYLWRRVSRFRRMGGPPYGSVMV